MNGIISNYQNAADSLIFSSFGLLFAEKPKPSRTLDGSTSLIYKIYFFCLEHLERKYTNLRTFSWQVRNIEIKSTQATSHHLGFWDIRSVLRRPKNLIVDWGLMAFVFVRACIHC